MQKNSFENILKIGPGNKIYFPLYVIYYISEQCEVRVLSSSTTRRNIYCILFYGSYYNSITQFILGQIFVELLLGSGGITLQILKV